MAVPIAILFAAMILVGFAMERGADQTLQTPHAE
jgi:hypothetical protein